MPDVRPPRYRRMTARHPGESHRPATALELFFDLCFVVAVAENPAAFEEELAAGRVGDARPRLRLGVLRDLVGVDELHVVRLRLRHRRHPVPPAHLGADHRCPGHVRAGGRPAATPTTPSSPGATSSCGSPWSSGPGRPLRTAPRGRCCLRYAAASWCSRLAGAPGDARRPAYPGARGPRAGGARDPRVGGAGRPHHLASAAHRRAFGLFTLIVLGETVLATTLAIQAAVDVGSTTSRLSCSWRASASLSSSRCGGSTSTGRWSNSLTRRRSGFGWATACT